MRAKSLFSRSSSGSTSCGAAAGGDRLEALRVARRDGVGERAQRREPRADREDQPDAEQGQRDHQRDSMCLRLAWRASRASRRSAIWTSKCRWRPGAEDAPAQPSALVSLKP